VDHRLAVVEENPLPFRLPFNPQRTPVGALQLQLHILCQRLDVWPGCTGDNDERVGDPEQLRDIEEDEINALLLIENGGDFLDELPSFGVEGDEYSAS
jgi:hypothetical protein